MGSSVAKEVPLTPEQCAQLYSTAEDSQILFCESKVHARAMHLLSLCKYTPMPLDTVVEVVACVVPLRRTVYIDHEDIDVARIPAGVTDVFVASGFAKVATARQVVSVLQHTPDMMSLHLGGMEKMKDEEFTDIVAVCPTSLQSLNLYCAGQLTSNSIVAIATAFPRLRELNVVGVYYHVTPTAYDTLLTGIGPNLERLSIGLRPLMHEGVPVEDLPWGKRQGLRMAATSGMRHGPLEDGSELMTFVAEKCPNLRKLEIVNHPTLTDDDVICIAEKCKRLECVNTSGTYRLSDTFFKKLPRNCVVTKAK